MSSSETHKVAGRQVLISLPPVYESEVAKRNMLDVLYVVDGGAPLFSQCVAQGRADYEAYKGMEGRQWHPDVIVVGLTQLPDESASTLATFVTTTLVPFVDSKYKTKPYAAGRAMCTMASGFGGSFVRKMLTEDADPGTFSNSKPRWSLSFSIMCPRRLNPGCLNVALPSNVRLHQVVPLLPDRCSRSG